MTKNNSKYELKDDQLENYTQFKTIQIHNEMNERVFVKNVPAQKIKSPIMVGNLLDRPQDVRWEHKNSHHEIIHPNLVRDDYGPFSDAGSFCANRGIFTISKDQNAKLVIFPLDSVNQNNQVRKCEIVGNMSCGRTVKGSVDEPTWVAYGATSGTVTVSNITKSNH